MHATRRQLLTVAVVGLLVASTPIALAQNGTVDEQEPNDRQENARTLELGTTVEAEIAGGDIDIFSWELDQDPNAEGDDEAEPARGVLSLSEEASGSLTYIVLGPATGYQIIKPGQSAEVFNTSGQTIISPDTMSIEVHPVDPSSYVAVQNQTPAEGSYTFTVESLGGDQSSNTDMSPNTSSQLPNTLSIRSTGDERVYYNATVSNSVAPGSGADLEGAEQPDRISDTKATGSTAQGGVDNFTFAGELTVLNLEGGPAEVYVNGKQVDPAEYQTDTPTPAPTPTETKTPTSSPTPTTTPTPTPTPTPTLTSTSTSAPTATPTPILSPTPTPTSTETRNVIQTDTSTATTMATPSSPDTQPNMTVTDTQTGDSTEEGGQIVDETETDIGSSSSGGPGFGVGISLVAVAMTILFAMRRY